MAVAKSDRTAKRPDPERRLRRHARYRVDFRVQVNHLHENHYQRVEGHGRDLSTGGIGMLLATDLDVGEVAGLDFSVPGASAPWQVRAVVRHRRGYHYGFEFLTLATDQRRTIEAYLSGLQQVD